MENEILLLVTDDAAAVGSNSVFVRGRMARISLPKEQNKFTIPPQGSPDLAAALLAWRTEHVKLIGASASGSLGGLAAFDPPVNAVPISEANG